MITLYQLPEAFGIPVSVSPYCAKVEVYLRLTGRVYRTEAGNLFQSPNKMVPYVKWPDGAVQAESDDILARLEAEGPALDEGLDAAAVARGRELVDAVQKRAYYACLYARFATEEGWKHQRPAVKAIVPSLLAPILCPLIRRSQIKRCKEAGFDGGDAAYASAVAAVDQVAETLGDQDFLLGEAPRTADCGAWAPLMHTTHTRVDNPARAAVRGHANLAAWIDRVAGRAGLKLPELPA